MDRGCLPRGRKAQKKRENKRKREKGEKRPWKEGERGWVERTDRVGVRRVKTEDYRNKRRTPLESRMHVEVGGKR
jgi:hypothetical protein